MKLVTSIRPSLKADIPNALVLVILLLSFLNIHQQAGAQLNINQNTSAAIDTSGENFTIPGLSSLGNITSSVEISPTVIDALKHQIRISLNDATTNATRAVGQNSSALGAFINSERDFLIFKVFLIDTNNHFYMVKVDPGNGRVLSTERVSPSTINAMMSTGLPSSITGISDSETYGGPVTNIVPTPDVPVPSN